MQYNSHLTATQPNGNTQQAPTASDEHYRGSLNYGSYPDTSAGHQNYHNGYASSAASNHQWNSSDNNPPTPLAAFPDDHPSYRIAYESDLVADLCALRIDSERDSSQPPLTPLGPMPDTPEGYEWHYSGAYLVPRADVNIGSGSGYAASAPADHRYLPTPPPEQEGGKQFYRSHKGQRGLPEWIAANPGRELADVLGEGDEAWRRGHASSRRQ